MPLFGVFVEPLADPPDHAAQMAVMADGAGLDLVGIQDHPYQRRYLDTWTLISTLVPQTERVRFFPDVASLPLRPPAMLAKAAASLDVISGGRIEVGLGAGFFWDAIEAMGGPRRSPGEAVRATGEAIEVMRLVWGQRESDSGRRSASFEGEFYRLKGLRHGPSPAHEIGLWVGASGKRMLSLTGRLADGWVPSNSYEPPEVLPEKHARIDEAAAEAGRDPGDISRIYNVAGSIGTAGRGENTDSLDGPVGFWVEELVRYALELRMDGFVFWPRKDPLRQIETFAREVVPAVKELVGPQHRWQRGTQEISKFGRKANS